MLRWQIAIQDYIGNMTIIYKEVRIHTNADGLGRWPLDNVKSNPPYKAQVSAKISTHIMEMNRKTSFKFLSWAPGIDTTDTDYIEPEERGTPILGISSSELCN
ncbi:hypothetical protein O181_084526 [Austropuccinia psidii MF-1]|uniref:Uncharacterized protein n=1 Tax=Austropuccinia psidii MF-1 TaxID=1389203 RepID=A0A9Q3IIW6_9BASI|nr:hypothetical protein [Austropuccinia psidii MF-1]